MFLNQVLEWMSDKFTRFLTVITGDHRYIHEGIGYTIITDTGSVAAGSSYSFSFVTPAASVGYIHLRPASLFATSNAMSITITEGAVVTGGASITPVNLNRNKSRASTITAAKGVTISTPGTTVIYFDATGSSGGVNSRSGGGSGGSEHERILKPATTYTMTVSNIGETTASTAYVDMFWYEEGKGA